MSYNCRRYIKHIDPHGTIHRLEVQQKDYSGSESSMKGTKSKGVFSFEHDKFAAEGDILKFYENVIQKGSLDVHIEVTDSTDFALLTDIFESDEDEFRLVWKRNDSVYWTGSVLNDLLEFEEASYPFSATIRAKDFSRLEGVDYGLQDARATWMDIISGMLSELGYDLDIHTATSWITSETTNTKDFLQQIYAEKKALRTFGRTGDEEDESITVYEALEQALKSNCLILKQIDGVFKLDQITAYEDPASVPVTVYDYNGVEKTSYTLTDRSLTYDRDVMRVTKGSISRGYPGLKRARVKYDHRTKVSNLKFPDVVRLESGGDLSESFSQAIVSDGDQRVTLTATLESQTDDTVLEQWALYTIEAGAYYYDRENREWTTSFVENEIDMTDSWASGGKLGWRASLSLETIELPEDADGQLIITLYISRNDTDGAADYTEWKDVRINIVNPIAEENSDSIHFRLTQNDSYSEEYTHADTWFGDGPLGYTVGALRYDTGNSDITLDAWARRGDTPDLNYHHNLLKEVLDIQRSWTQRIDARLWGVVDVTKILSYRSKNYYYGGGTFTGRTGDWNVSYLEVSVETGLDDFDDILSFDSAERGANTGAGDTYQIAAENRRFNDSQKITTITDELSGTVSSIPIEAAGVDFVNVGDEFYVFSLRRASLTSFTLAAPQQEDDTSLEVEPKEIDETIPRGSWIVFTGGRISSYITRTDTAIQLGVKSYEKATDEDGEALVDEDGEEIVFTEEDEGSTLELLQEQATLKVNSDGKLALVRLDTSAEEGSVITIEADQIDIKSVKTAINAEEEISLIADDVNINNINFDQDTGTISTDNFEEAVSGWQITGAGDAEFNSVALRNGVMEDSDIRNLTVKGEIKNEDGDYRIDEEGIHLNRGASGKLGVGIKSAVKFGEYNEGEYAGFIAAYNDGGTASVDRGVLWLVGGYRDDNDDGVGDIVLEGDQINLQANKANVDAEDITLTTTQNDILLDADENVELKAGNAVIVNDATPFRLPRMTDSQRDALTGVQQGYKIYNTTDQREQVWDGSTWARVSYV